VRPGARDNDLQRQGDSRMSFSRALRRIEQLLLRWAEEPIGVLVPAAAFVAVWMPPQMPDMFAGM
jgi:hypothetical protein